MQKKCRRTAAGLPLRALDAFVQSEERIVLFQSIAVRAAMLSLLIGAAAPSAVAANAPPYAQLLRQSLENAPALLEQAANVSAARAEARQARAWRNPSLSAEYENLGAPASNGISQRQDTYTVTQVFELGGKRAARIETEERKLSAASARSRQAQVVIAAELAVAYATAEAAQLRQALAADEVARANEDLRAAQALVKVGREAQLRVAQAQASIAAAQASQQLAIADTTEALARLSALVGSSESFTGVDVPFLAPSLTYSPGAAATPDDAPAVVSAAADRDALAAQVRVEERRWLPDLGVSAGWRKFGGNGGDAKTVGLSLSVPLFDRNQGGIDAARARVSGAEARLDAARLQAGALQRAAMARIAAADLRLQAAQQGESAADEAYRMARLGYDAGKTPLIELLASRRALYDAKTLTIEANLARVRAVAELSAAQGRIAFGETK